MDGAGVAKAPKYPIRESATARALAFNVERHRKSKNWSQEELAAEAGITQDMVSTIENNRANPTVLTVEQIAEALGINFVDLFAPPPRSQRSKA